MPDIALRREIRHLPRPAPAPLRPRPGLGRDQTCGSGLHYPEENFLASIPEV